MVLPGILIKWLQHNGYPDLTEAEIEEEYSPAIYTSDDYLKTKRIELDSITAKVGAAGLWKYILHRLQSPEIAPQGFDLNQAVTIPANEVFYPKTMSDLLTYLNNYTDSVLSSERELIKQTTRRRQRVNRNRVGRERYPEDSEMS